MHASWPFYIYINETMLIVYISLNIKAVKTFPVYIINWIFSWLLIGICVPSIAPIHWGKPKDLDWGCFYVGLDKICCDGSGNWTYYTGYCRNSIDPQPKALAVFRIRPPSARKYDVSATCVSTDNGRLIFVSFSADIYGRTSSHTGSS